MVNTVPIFLYSENPTLGVGFKSAQRRRGEKGNSFCYHRSAVRQLHKGSRRRSNEDVE